MDNGQNLTVPGQLVNTKVPQFVWKCIRKMESDPSLMVTEGIYRIPGDASKIQKIRLDIDQVNRLLNFCSSLFFFVQDIWDTFDKCDDIHVLAGSLKLFLRELPEPLLPYFIHNNLQKAAQGKGSHGKDIVSSMEAELEKLEVEEMATLAEVVRHLGKVAAASNKMDVDNLSLLFGQVLLWPDMSNCSDLNILAGRRLQNIV